MHFINKKGCILCSVVCSIILTGRAFCKWELGDWNNMCPSSHHILHLAHSEGFSLTGGKYAQITNHYKSKEVHKQWCLNFWENSNMPIFLNPAAQPLKPWKACRKMLPKSAELVRRVLGACTNRSGILCAMFGATWFFHSWTTVGEGGRAGKQTKEGMTIWHHAFRLDYEELAMKK